MRKLSVILVGLLFSIPVIAQKRAILIGVSDYPEGSGWCKLNAHNDVTLLKDALAPEWDIITLEDGKATHDGIVSTLRNAAITVSSGDTVLIHFSGHGQQMLPIETDSRHDPDMLDEAIIPYDAKKDWSPDYTGQNHIRDNEFGDLIEPIRNNAGVSGLVVVVLDACHSDSMQRIPDSAGGSIIGYRGTADIFGRNITADEERNRYKRDTSRVIVDNNASVVYLSACQAYSRNAEITDPEGVGYGSLSYAVAGALKEGGIRDINKFLDCVVVAMDTLVPYQFPGIRASFDYQRPVISKDVKPQVNTSEDNKGAHLKAYMIAIALALALSLFIVIWRKKRV